MEVSGMSHRDERRAFLIGALSLLGSKTLRAQNAGETVPTLAATRVLEVPPPSRGPERRLAGERRRRPRYQALEHRHGRIAESAWRRDADLPPDLERRRQAAHRGRLRR